MTHPAATVAKERKYPFVNMKISDYSILTEIQDRSPCFKCGKSRKYFCYTCYVPIEQLCDRIPKVKLPVKVDIIKHPSEIGKSTAVHGPILAPEDVQIFTYPDIPDYSKEEGVVLIFPCATSLTISQLFDANVRTVRRDDFDVPKGYNMGTLLKVRLEERREQIDRQERESLEQYSIDSLPIKKAVFIDSTWNQSRGIYKDDRVNCLKSVVLQNRISQFWRHQKGSPRWYLATIEAIHQFVLEVHINAWGLDRSYRGLDELEISEGYMTSVEAAGKIRDVDPSVPADTRTAPYKGQYDNLLYFFAHMYDLIHIYYDHNELKSYKRPI